MSHFVAIVLVDGAQTEDDVQPKLQELLAPYDENIEAPEYEEECWCVGRAAKQDVRAEVEAVISPIAEQLRTEAAAWVEEEVKRNPESDARMMIDWPLPFQDRAIEMQRKAEDMSAKLYEQHPLSATADPKCDECGGSGQTTSTYNPKSKWDWYVVGGRWTGYLVPEYDPSMDVRNMGPCMRCSSELDLMEKVELSMAVSYGKEERAEELKAQLDPSGKIKQHENGLWGRAEEDDPEAVECPSCNGTKVARYDANAPFLGDVQPVAHWLELLEKGECFPHSLVTPDGEWHERGKMGWFASVHNEKKADEWEPRVLEIAKAQPATVMAVVVDCHI